MILQNAHFVAQNQAIQGFQPLLFSLNSLEDINKMQTSDYTGSHSEQHYPTQNSGGLLLVCLVSLGALLFYLVQHGLIVESFIYALSYFFDDFHVNIKKSNITADIALLIFSSLATVGLYKLIKEQFLMAVLMAAALIIALIYGG